MSGKWVEVVRLRFVGDRFRDHGLDVRALSELIKFQHMIEATAEELWKAANGRVRLPSGFGERTRLWLREIRPGSAIAPLEANLGELTGQLLESEPKDAADAVGLVHEVYDALRNDRALPDRLPKHMVADYAKLGGDLEPGESIEIQSPNRQAVVCGLAERQTLSALIEKGYEDTSTVEGRVLEADVRQMRFQLWKDDGAAVSIAFSKQQEADVTTALKEHESVRVRASGRGEFSFEGRPLRLIVLEDLRILHPVEPDQPDLFALAGPPVEDELDRLASEVPLSVWSKLPIDLSERHDHYIYGTPDP